MRPESRPPSIPPLPSVLHLVQMIVVGRIRASGEELYREVARTIGAERGRDVVVVGCGAGETAEWLAVRTGASLTGVDWSEDLLEKAESRRRLLQQPVQLSFQQSPLDDLPHETGVFDAAVGEPPLSSAKDPSKAVAELTRVTKPMGSVVLLQLTWSSELRGEAREMLVERLGMRPHLLVEWKQMMRDAGLVDIQVQDWTTAGSLAAGVARRTGEVEIPTLTWQQKAQIVARGLRRWGWREARGALERETELLRELSHERAIGFQLLSGVKWPHATTSGT